MCSSRDFDTIAFFGRVFQGKVKSVWCNWWEKNQRFVATSHGSRGRPTTHMRRGVSDTVLKYLLRECLIHMALLTHQVDKVHVCPPLTSLSCLTYIFPSHSPTTLSLFFPCAARSIWPPRIVFLGMTPGFSLCSFSRSFFKKNKIRSFQCLPWL